MYLHEICQDILDHTGVEVSEATICIELGRHGFTRKKIRVVAAQRSTALRGQFMAQALLFSKDLFVSVDETGCDRRNYIRKYGYAIRGQTPVSHQFLVRGKRVCAVTAMATDGLVGVELITGTTNGEVFFDFVRGTLIPQ